MFKLVAGETGHFVPQLGRVVPRVTVILGMVKSDNLIRYLMKRCAERALFWRARVTNNPTALERALDDMQTSDAAEKGTYLHALAEKEGNRIRDENRRRKVSGKP